MGLAIPGSPIRRVIVFITAALVLSVPASAQAKGPEAASLPALVQIYCRYLYGPIPGQESDLAAFWRRYPQYLKLPQPVLEAKLRALIKQTRGYNSQAARVLLCERLIQQRNWDRTMPELAPLVAAQDPESVRLTAMIDVRKGEDELALSDAKRYLKKRKNALGFADLALALARRRAYQAAKRVLSRTRELCQELPEILHVESKLVFMDGNYSAAASALETYLALVPDDALARDERLFALAKLGRDKEIEDFMINFEANEFQRCLRTGSIYAAAHKPRKALKLYTRAIELCPTSFHAWAARAGLFRDLTLPEEAIQDAKRALTIEPDNPHMKHVLTASQKLIEARNKRASPGTKKRQLSPNIME